MKQFYATLSENKRVIFWTIIVTFCGLILGIPLCFFNYWDIPIGWLFGSAIAILSFIVLCKEATIIVDNQSKWLFMLFYFLRFLLYLLGLVIAFILVFNHIKIINPYAVFVGYIPIKIVILCLGGR